MRVLLLIALIAVNGETGFAQKRNVRTTRGVAVAFFDEVRLRNRADGQAMLENFEFFRKMIQEVANRDFPDVEFKIVRRGEFLRLPDGTGLNVQNLSPELGYVLSARGKKRRILSGVQSEVDFACAAAAFFRRSSPACPK